MSYVLEGIIVPVSQSAAADQVINCDIKFDVLALEDNVSILARPGRPAFNDSVCEVARRLSTALSASLLVRWDDRVGFRESRVFQNGNQTFRFSNDDELYVVLDDDGMPVREGRKFKESELDDSAGLEFEVFQNALELGCGKSGFCQWPLLHGFIQSQT